MILGILVALAIFISMTKFNVNNPFDVLNGLYQIAFADTEYIEIQNYPKVVIAKPKAALDTYMEEHGFAENKEEQSDSVRMFEARYATNLFRGQRINTILYGNGKSDNLHRT